MPDFSPNFTAKKQVAFLWGQNGHFVTFSLYVVVGEVENLHILRVSLHNYFNITAQKVAEKWCFAEKA